MIHPCLATMLAVVTTDYPLAAGRGARLPPPAVDESFNRISVDGECSTNDTVVLLANGASGVERAIDDARSRRRSREVCADLAGQIVADGEGATVLLEIEVTGAASDGEAPAIARRIATSPLVKTAAFGHDPNWGRVLVAAGSASYNGGFAQLDPDRLTVAFNGTHVFAAGAPVDAEPDVEGARLPDRARPRARRRPRLVPRLRPLVRLRAHQRGVPDVSRVIVKVGGAAPPRGGSRAGARAPVATRSSSSTAPGRRSPPRWSGAGSTCASSAAGA